MFGAVRRVLRAHSSLSYSGLPIDTVVCLLATDCFLSKCYCCFYMQCSLQRPHHCRESVSEGATRTSPAAHHLASEAHSGSRTPTLDTWRYLLWNGAPCPCTTDWHTVQAAGHNAEPWHCQCATAAPQLRPTLAFWQESGLRGAAGIVAYKLALYQPVPPILHCCDLLIAKLELCD